MRGAVVVVCIISIALITLFLWGWFERYINKREGIYYQIGYDDAVEDCRISNEEWRSRGFAGPKPTARETEAPK